MINLNKLLRMAGTSLYPPYKFQQTYGKISGLPSVDEKWLIQSTDHKLGDYFEQIISCTKDSLIQAMKNTNRSCNYWPVVHSLEWWLLFLRLENLIHQYNNDISRSQPVSTLHVSYTDMNKQGLNPPYFLELSLKVVGDPHYLLTAYCVN